jgi:hypothetical protein
MIRLILIFLIPAMCAAQHKGVSFKMSNEVGTFQLTSLTFSHRIDNTDGITYVTDRSGKDTIYRLNGFLSGYVGLSNDGRTIVELRTEKEGAALKRSVITFYRNGEKFESAELNQFLKYELDEAIRYGRIPNSGWLKNDSLLHKMASNAFYVTDDRVYLSFDGPILQVFDINRMFHIYTGNGANHFMQNYHSIPHLPLRTEYNSSEYFPKGFPKTEIGITLEETVSAILQSKSSIPEEARYRVELELRVLNNGTDSIIRSKVFDIRKNVESEEDSKRLFEELSKLKFDTTLLPPAHPVWIFHGNLWLK